MLCPLKMTNADDHLCDKDKCGFYSCESQKCAIASLGDIANELAELNPRPKLSTSQIEWIKNHYYGYEIK